MKKSLWIFPLAGILMLGCGGKINPGVAGGKLAPCPSSPNCVSTQAVDEKHRMEPAPYTGSAQEAMDRILAVIKTMPRAKILVQEPDYLHVVFSSKVFKFKDDVEFYVDDREKLIQFRSASRLGYSDFGANRKRMNLIREKLAE